MVSRAQKIGFARPSGRSRKNRYKPDDDLDPIDVLGDKAETDALAAADDPDAKKTDVAVVFRGVSINWLSQAFGMDVNTVKKRLGRCPVWRRTDRWDLYKLREAAAYLVEPKVDIEEWVKSRRIQDIPPHINAMFWDGALKRQKWEENAGQLWRTEKVRDVFAEIAMRTRDTIQLWVDTVERNIGLTEEQRKLIVDLSDALRNELYESLVNMADVSETESSLSEAGEIKGIGKKNDENEDSSL